MTQELMTQETIRVVSAVISQDGKYLITQRRESASMPSLWEFPGGRVEQGESDADALKREIEERIGLVLIVEKPVAFRRHEYEGRIVELVLYEALVEFGEIEPKKVQDYKWVAVEHISEYPFPPADSHTRDDYKLMVSRGKRRKLPQA